MIHGIVDIGDMIEDPEDQSLGIVFAYDEESQRYSIHWFARYSGVTKEHYREFSYGPEYGGFYKIA